MAKEPSEKSKELYRNLKVHFSEEFAAAITKNLSTDFTAVYDAPLEPTARKS